MYQPSFFDYIEPASKRTSPGDCMSITDNQVQNIKLSSRGQHTLVGSGNDTLDKILGGGLLMGTVNICEFTNRHTNPMNSVIRNTFASSTLANGQHLIIISCNMERKPNMKGYLSKVPKMSKVKFERLNSDLSTQDRHATRIKIAWRYQNLGSPSEHDNFITLPDFGTRLMETDIGSLPLILPLLHAIHAPDYAGDIEHMFEKLISCVQLAGLRMPEDSLKSNIRDHDQKPNHGHSHISNVVNIIILDAVDPLSCINLLDIPRLVYKLRALTRSQKNCTVLFPINSELILASLHSYVLPRIRRVADQVLEFASFIDDQSSPYPDCEGILNIVKLAKVNSISFHYDRLVSDWGYRQTKDKRFYVFDRLSLPPADDEDSKTQKSTIITSDARLSSTMACGSSTMGSIDDF